MKLFIITIDDVYEFEGFHHDPIVRLTRTEARKELARLKAEAKDTYKGQFDECTGTRDSFSMYPQGYWGTSHFDACIDEVEVPDVIRVRTRN